MFQSLLGVPITAWCSNHCQVFQSLPSSSVVAVHLGLCQAVDLGFSCAHPLSLSSALTCNTFAVKVLLVNHDNSCRLALISFLRAVLLCSPVIICSECLVLLRHLCCRLCAFVELSPLAVVLAVNVSLSTHRSRSKAFTKPLRHKQANTRLDSIICATACGSRVARRPSSRQDLIPGPLRSTFFTRQSLVFNCECF